jgi:hypothetical protein
MPQAFLMRVMEWNEAVEEARGAAPDSPERRATHQLGETLREERRARLETIGSLLTPLPPSRAPQLAEARRELNVVRYIDRTQKVLESLRLETASREKG